MKRENKMTPKEIILLIKEYVPIVHDTIPMAREVGKELIPILESMTDSMVDLQLRALKRYKDAGLDHNDAMKLVVSHKIALMEGFNRGKNK